MNTTRLPRISLTIFFFAYMISPAYTDPVDFIEYTQFANPPMQSDFNGAVTDGATYVSRIVYTSEFTYHDFNALRIEKFDGATTPDEMIYTQYWDYNDDNFIFYGILFENEDFGTIDLLLNPPFSASRWIDVGQTIQETSQSSIKIGPIPASVKVDITVNFLALESLEVPFGSFENTLKTEIILVASLAGVELGQIQTIEWYHPSVGVVKTQTESFNQTTELVSVTRDTSIYDWMMF